MKDGLGMAEEDELVGFLYLGTPAFEPASKPERDTSAYFEHWNS